MSPTTRDAGAPMCALALRIQINAGTNSGQAIAIAAQGSGTIYLVMPTSGGPPVWIADSEIESCYALSPPD